MCRSVIRMVNQPFLKPANEEGLISFINHANIKFARSKIEFINKLKIRRNNPYIL